jgi:hypothetical protein
MATGATFVYSTPGGEETRLGIAFANPASDGDIMLFFDRFTESPRGVPIAYHIDVYDDVGNTASTEPAEITLPCLTNDSDGDIDLLDYQVSQREYTGPQ